MPVVKQIYDKSYNIVHVEMMIKTLIYLEVWDHEIYGRPVSLFVISTQDQVSICDISIPF